METNSKPTAGFLYSHQLSISPDLLTLLRADASEDQVRGVLESLNGHQAWNVLLAEVDRQDVMPLLYRVLKPYPGQIPLEIWHHLAQSYFDTATLNALRLDEWEKVVGHLAEQGVKMLVLKGAALAEELYGEIAVRPMKDLDLLVQREELAAAQAVLAERGYAPVKAEAFTGAAEEFESQVSLARQDAATGMKYVCELHWHLLDSPFYQRTMSLDWFWQTAVPLTLDGVETQTLGPEARLLHLCAHLALHHHGAGLLWTCDIDRALREDAGRLDWELVMAKAEEYRLVLPLRAVLAQTVEWLDTPVPAEVMARLAALRPSCEEAEVFAFMAGPPQGVIARFFHDLAHLSGWQARLQYLLANIFPAPAYMRQRYGIHHDWLLPLYYLYRLGKGAWDGVRMLARR
jgi:hypothetical protein